MLRAVSHPNVRLDLDAAHPESAAAMLGAQLINIGRQIRTDMRARHVSAEQFAQFRTWLCRAEAVLIDAAARNPADPAVWTQRPIAGRGLGVGRSEVRRRYELLAATAR